MSVKLYVLPSSSSSRKTKKFLEDNNIEFTIQNMCQNPLSKDQLFEILSRTEYGVDDILSDKSNDYKVLTQKGVVFDDLSLTEFHELITEYPKLLRAPIVVKNDLTLVGYNDEEIKMLLNREDKKKEFQRVLNKIRAKEDKKMASLGILKITQHDMDSSYESEAI